MSRPPRSSGSTSSSSTSSNSSTTTRTGPLPEALRAAVLRIAEQAGAADGSTALSEDAVLRLSADAPSTVTHVLRYNGSAAPGSADDPVGYAQLVLPDGHGRAAGQGEGELLVAPTARRAGHGGALLARVGELAGGTPVRLWSHGDTPGAAALAARTGWTRVRDLLKLHRPTAGVAGFDVPALPDGIAVVPFRPGDDDDAWVALNAAAFAGHPEQGRWGVADLRLRTSASWFDPSTFLLARPADAPGVGAPIAFCWMKVEDDVAELYVLGVAPGHDGRGLGRALLVRGLQAVAARVSTVELYVDGDNVAAVRLYERLGFTRASIDVQYAAPTPSPADHLPDTSASHSV